MPLPKMFVLPKWCRPGRTHHPEVIGSMATSPGEMIEIAAREAPNLLTIPLEMRFQIFSYLVSNNTITTKRNNDDDDEGITTASYPIPSILLVNRQLNAEAFSYIYRTNTLTLSMDSYSLSFHGVNYPHYGRWYYEEGAEPPSPLPQHFPYSSMKEVVIEVQVCLTRSPQIEACEARRILRKLCGRLLSLKIHFRLLRIRFPSPEGKMMIDDATESGRISTDDWDTLWDSNNPRHADEALLEQAFPFAWQNIWGSVRDYARIPFDYPNCPSTFAWVLSVFALCPAVANECVIELPKSLQGKVSMREVADRYEKILDGRLTNEEEDFLEEDQWALSHPDPYGYCKKKTCRICIRNAAERAERSRRQEIEHDVKERLLHAWALRDSIIAPGVEYWESPLQYWRDDDLTSWWWEKARKWTMDAMEVKWGLQEGRNLYHRYFWVLEKFGRNYSKKQIQAWEDFVGDDLPRLRKDYRRQIHSNWDTLAGFKPQDPVW